MLSTPNTVPPFHDDQNALDCIPADETFDGTWPFTPRFYHGNGFAQHYVDEGEGDPIVLLHGEPTWGYLYRNFIPALSKTHRVIVPDHMGFGKSATPQDREYCLRTHTLNLIGLLESLNLDKPATFFIQDWGSLIGMQYALRYPSKVARIMLGSAVPMAATLEQKIARFGGHEPDQYGRMPLAGVIAGRPEINADQGVTAGTATKPASSWFPWILTGIPDDPDYVCSALASERPPEPRGRTESVLLNSGSTVIQTISHLMGLENKAVMTESWIRAYASAFPTQAASVGALNFPMEAMSQLKMSPEAQAFPHEAVTPESVQAVKDIPLMLVVGRHDHAISLGRIKETAASYGGCPYLILEKAGHFLQEDAPETVVALLQAFMQMTGGDSPTFDDCVGVPPPGSNML